MKTLALILAALVTVTAFAETPEQIAADYRAKAKTALERLNKTLDTEAAKISATLLALGDSAAVNALAEQVKAKQAGDEAVANPVPQAVQLFTAYDAARVKALAPVSDSTLRRIEATLASSDGKKTEIVAELAKLKTDVLSGRVPPEAPKVPIEWTYHQTPTGKADAAIRLNPDGVFTLNDGLETKTGKWKAYRKGAALVITLDKDEWEVSIKDGLGTIKRDVGIRYMRPVTSK